jgi:NADH-quinone oxidoreductase subunit G
MIDIEIDGRAISVEPGTTIIEAADQLGIYIPRFCYHKKLSIAANCRMCLVEVEKVGKPLPACATPVTQGMKVYTVSKKAVEAQKIVMEFLLINHPLDCPICDQGGECELQDLSMGYGGSHSYYEQSKRAVFNENLGPLIDTEMTRCIQCTRCVRFGEEIAGMRELGVTFRGEHEQIGTYVQQMIRSEVSGNVIDLCPVGALTAKPSRYSLRGWEVREHPLIAPHDGVGTNLFVHTRGQEYAPQREVMRVVPRENADINETWISDRDRFSYLGLRHPDRVFKPRVKRNGQWQEIDWQPALLEVADRTKAVLEHQGPDQIAALLSPNSTTEECYLFQKWLRAMGSHHIDHRVRQQDFSDQSALPLFPSLGLPIAAMEDLKAVLLIGSHIRYEQPLLGLRLNKAAQEGARIMAVNPMDYHFVFPVREKIITADVVSALADIAAALTQNPSQATQPAAAIAQQLRQAGDKAAIFLGEYALSHPQAAQIRAWVQRIRQQTPVAVGVLSEGANSAGAWLAGAVPHRGPGGTAIAQPGTDAHALLTSKPKRVYFLLGLEPEFDCAAPASALKNLQQAGLVVCLTTHVTSAMEEYADFILPITPFTENTGTFVNIEGTAQSFSAVSVPSGEAKPAWKICRVLANFMELSGFDYADIHAVQDELREFITHAAPPQQTSVSEPVASVRTPAQLTRLAPWPLYRVDPLVRRASALQETMSGRLAGIAVNPTLAAQLQVTAGQPVTARQGDSQITLPLRIDDRLADDVVFIPSALAETAGFGQVSAAITLEGERSE